MPAPIPVREGARWRHARPNADEVAAWFQDVPLDEGMDREKYVSGLVLIPQKEKVKRSNEAGTGVVDVEELTFTPYIRVDSRIAYFRALAEKDNLIAVIEPVKVPQTAEQPYANAHMPDGFWWFPVATDANSNVRFVCCTMRVALYEREAWLASAPKSLERDGTKTTTATPAVPLREGVATKQVAVLGRYGPDTNALAKAETGAIGRALGMAGILVLGTGIATAEDMNDLRDAAPAEQPTLPEGEESEDVLNARLIGLESGLRKASPEQHRQFTAWWQERSGEAGWAQLKDAPVEVRRGMVRRLEHHHEEAKLPQAPAAIDAAPEEAPADSSQSGDVAPAPTADGEA